MLSLHSKIYYRLSELKSDFGITVDHIRYAIEHHGLCLSFYLSSEKFLFAGHGEKGFVLLGSGYIRGLLTLSSDRSLELLRGKTIKVDYARVHSSDSISYWEPSNPFESEIPKTLARGWLPTDLSKAKELMLFAKPYPEEIKNVQDRFKQLLTGLSQFQREDNRASEEFISEKAKGITNSFLSPQKFSIELADACINASALKFFGLNDHFDSASKPHGERLTRFNGVTQKTSGNETSRPNRLRHQPNSLSEPVLDYYSRGSLCKKLVWHLKGMYPSKGAAYFWKLLHASQEDEELMDTLDPDGDIYEIDKDSIYWNIPSKFQNEDIDKTTGRRRFENVVSDWNKLHK